MTMDIWKFDLDGEWLLTGVPETGALSTREIHISAMVPGNIELDLQHAGLIGDPFVARNAAQVREFEYHRWKYEREFVCPDAPEAVELVLDGVDCLARIILNGEELGRTENALIPHRLKVGKALKKGRNHLAVELTPPMAALHDFPMQGGTLSGTPLNYVAVRFRQPAHVWGWDILPRLPLGGIFRSLRLEEVPGCRIVEDRLQLLRLFPGGGGELIYQYKIDNGRRECRDMRLVIEGECKGSVWRHEEAVWAPLGWAFIVPGELRLWQPRGYGEAALYDIKVTLYQAGEPVAHRRFTTGLRLVQIERNPCVTEGAEPDFRIRVNGGLVRVRGTNHVPADALHSRDARRLPAILELADELGCNMIRVWGGGVYEPDEFYDFCDRHGIMVWQDFMMACGVYPRDPAFLQALTVEVESVIRRLRHHPSILLWAGDNECDCSAYWMLLEQPENNRITRELLPQLCSRHDPGRPFLNSSPEYTPRAIAACPENPEACCPEQHLWGARDYFKSDFYRLNRAAFSSEVGCPGCPSISSLKCFLDPECIWPPEDNPQWLAHGTNPYGADCKFYDFRTGLLRRHIELFFGFRPENVEDFALASQIYQAEALKYLIELARTSPKITGLLWWNLIDGWPQLGEGVVDYYFRRKLAFHYIRRVQRELLVAVGEAVNWRREVIVVNDTARSRCGRYSIRRSSGNEEVAAGSFEVAARSILRCPGLPDDPAHPDLLLIQWETEDGEPGCNHLLTGMPHFDFSRYRAVWLPAIAGLDGSFDAAQTAR